MLGQKIPTGNFQDKFIKLNSGFVLLFEMGKKNKNPQNEDHMDEDQTFNPRIAMDVVNATINPESLFSLLPDNVLRHIFGFLLNENTDTLVPLDKDGHFEVEIEEQLVSKKLVKETEIKPENFVGIGYVVYDMEDINEFLDRGRKFSDDEDEEPFDMENEDEEGEDEEGDEGRIEPELEVTRALNTLSLVCKTFYRSSKSNSKVLLFVE
jgi:hypothetical protein